MFLCAGALIRFMFGEGRNNKNIFIVACWFNWNLQYDIGLDTTNPLTMYVRNVFLSNFLENSLKVF